MRSIALGRWPRAIERIELFPAPRGKYSGLLTSQTLNNCILFHHIFGLRDLLTMYISFIENNAEPNSSSAKEEAGTSSTGRLFFVLRVILSAD